MKSWIRSIGCIAIAGVLLCSTGCVESKPEKYTITFVQNGQDNVVVEVPAGQNLKNPPKPKDKTGYTVEWDKTSFENITKDIVVNAVETPNEYLITYMVADDETFVGEYTQTVEFDAQYELSIPTKYGYAFVDWYNGNTPISRNGTWKIADNVSLTARWSDNSYTLTFVHADGVTEERSVKMGETLTDIPNPRPVPGYDVYWTVSDFSSITSSMAVGTRKEAKTYTITFNVRAGETLKGEGTQELVFGSVYTLGTTITHMDKDLVFSYWKNATTGERVPKAGTWKIDGNVTLEAVWEESDEYTKDY